MITLSVIKARMKRQKIPTLAEPNYMDKSELLMNIPALHQYLNEQFLFGIYDSPAKWTVMSVRKLFACYNSELFYLILNKESDKIHKFYGQDGLGDKHSSDVILADGRKIWMKSAGLSCGIQNIILMLEKLPDNVMLGE